ncbi:hypothetical protein VP01_6206g1, partial [Puccinia sorghi]
EIKPWLGSSNTIPTWLVQMQIDEIVPTDPEKSLDNAPWRPTVDGTMQFLMSELLKAGKDCPAPNSVADPTTSPNLPGISKLSKYSSATTSNLAACVLGNKLEKADKHQVAAFSHAFISPDAKSKHEILKFMLCDLIPTGPLSQSNTTESQKRLVMVLVALCHEPNAGKEPSFVMQSSLKNWSILASVDCMLCSTLDSVSLPPRPLLIDPQPAPNFVALLSNALADVDLNFHSVQRLLILILRPLEHLTKAVTKISQASSKRKGGDSTAALASMIEVESVPPTESLGEDEEMMPTKEDAPDLYQNSAL